MSLAVTAKILRVDKLLESPAQGTRFYPKSVIKAALKKQREQLRTKNPVGFYMKDEASVRAFMDSPAMLDDTRNVSHLVTNIELKEDWVVATIKIVDTFAGRLLESAVKNDHIAFRPAGTARLAPDQKVVGYTFLTVNAFDPSLVLPFPK